MVKTSQDLAYNHFLKTDLSEHIGEWIAVDHTKILAHGKNLKEVVEKAKTISGGNKFILARVPSEETMIF